MALNVSGYVNGEPVYYEETTPTNYIGTSNPQDTNVFDNEIQATDDFGNRSLLEMTYFTGGWVEPITNRDGMTPSYLNAEDLNRIESDCKYLWETLTYYGYYCINYGWKTDWLNTDIPFDYELERIRKNIVALETYYHNQPTLIPTSLQYPTYVKVNYTERILLEMYEMVVRMEKSFKYCGAYYCGQGVVSL